MKRVWPVIAVLSVGLVAALIWWSPFKRPSIIGKWDNINPVSHKLASTVEFTADGRLIHSVAGAPQGFGQVEATYKEVDSQTIEEYYKGTSNGRNFALWTASFTPCPLRGK